MATVTAEGAKLVEVVGAGLEEEEVRLAMVVVTKAALVTDVQEVAVELMEVVVKAKVAVANLDALLQHTA